MLTRERKQQLVEELRDQLGRANGLIVADYRGVDVAAANQLRSELRKVGAGAYAYRVAKNTLLRRAAQGLPAEQTAELFRGPTAVALSFGDPVGLAKVLVDFAKQHEVFEIRGGLVEGRPVGPEEVATLATLPSLEDLRARLVGLIQAPAAKIARVLAAPGGQLARLIEARRASLEEGGAG